MKRFAKKTDDNICSWRGGTAMKAGRELDALIAEKVMGLCGHYLIRDVRKGEEVWDDYITWTCEKCDKEFRGLAYGAGYKNPNLKHYSTRIQDAWQVVEKLAEITKKDVLVEHCTDGERLCTIGWHHSCLLYTSPSPRD